MRQPHPRQRQETPEGIELQFATNVLGYFWMIQLLGGRLKASAPAPEQRYMTLG